MIQETKKYPVIENVFVDDAGAEGQAVSKQEDWVIFIKGAVPGDTVDVEVLRKKSRYREARVKRIITPSDKRIEPFCEHFGTCGGCKWQNMKYEWQLHYKQKQVEDNFKRIGKFEFPSIRPILPSEKQQFYRNKLEFAFSNKKWLTQEQLDDKSLVFEGVDRWALGFHLPGKFDKVLDINQCYLQTDPSNRIRLEMKKYASENKLDFFDIYHQVGFLRNMVIRTSSTGELMLIVIFFYEDEVKRIKLLDHLASKFPEITSLMYIINGKKNAMYTDLPIVCYKGKDHIIEEMEDLKFKVGPKSFYQTNAEQAYQLYKITREFAAIKPHEVVYDLYTGTGTIANFVARQAQKVVGVEYVADAIEDAKINSSINGINNTSFFAGDMKKILNNDFISANGAPHVIIVDPPRAGMDPPVVEQLLRIGADRIVYVSCNPATQARDIALMDQQYKVTAVQPVDMFPQTHHVENVVLLEKK